jgi:ribonucleoside-diphosphate reductase alpha chain
MNNETFNEWLDRVSNGNENIKKLIIEKKFLFGGRILASRGLQNKGRKITMSNCYVIEPPEDNIESIFDCAKKLARTYSYGGGCGIDISKLSPKGSRINNAAKETSGSVSFMDLYSLVTELIGQSGRRGALMISIDCSHPDIMDFVNIKSDLNKVTKANISIKITDEFMDAVMNDKPWELKYIRKETGEEIKNTISAKELFHKLALMNWDYAEPGLLNWSRITNWNLLSEDGEFEYAGVNP